MARHSMDKKELRQDVIRERMLALVALAEKKRKSIIAASVVLVALIGLIFAYGWQQGRALEEQAAGFYAVEKIITDSTAAGSERNENAVKALKAFIAAHPDARLAPYAWMYLAQIYWGEDKNEEAKNAFKIVLEHGSTTEFTRNLALIGEAKLYEGDGGFKRSEERYRNLPDKPFSDLKAYNLGRLAAADKRPQEAREHFKKVVNHFPPSRLARWANDAMSVLP